MKAERVEIVFSFSNPKNVPSALKWKEPNDEIYFSGKDTPVVFGERVSMERIFMDLWEKNFFVQEAFAQRRRNASNKYFTNVRFSFRNGKSKPAFCEKLLSEGFRKLAKEAFWNLKIFVHKETVVIACSFRHARMENGKFIRVWDKDPVTREKIGAGPHHIRPEGTLRFSGEFGIE